MAPTATAAGAPDRVADSKSTPPSMPPNSRTTRLAPKSHSFPTDPPSIIPTDWSLMTTTSGQQLKVHQPAIIPPRTHHYPRHPTFTSNRLGGGDPDAGGSGVAGRGGGFQVDRPLAGVLVIGGILLFVSMSLTAAVIVFCKKKNTVFVLQKSEEGQADDSDLELDDVLTDLDSSADWRSRGGSCGDLRYTPLALTSLPRLLISLDTGSGRRLVCLAGGGAEEAASSEDGGGGGGDEAEGMAGAPDRIFGNRYARDLPPSDDDSSDDRSGGGRLRRLRSRGPDSAITADASAGTKVVEAETAGGSGCDDSDEADDADDRDGRPSQEARKLIGSGEADSSARTHDDEDPDDTGADDTEEALLRQRQLVTQV